jgi:hypothetical protein
LRPDRPYNPEVQAPRFGLFRVRSPLLAESLLFSLPAGTEMVHFPALPSPPYEFRWRYGGITRRGFPHSDIPGSKLVCSSPRLIAAYRVLHRLLAPRHSPYALSSLIIGIETDTCRFTNRRATVSLPKPSQKHCACLWIGKNYRLQDIQLSKNRLRSVASASHRAPNLKQTFCPARRARRTSSPDRKANMVENTGLEPVTSWLQTRRSPS